MRVLVLYAHPVETSFNAVLQRAVVERLTERGHEVDLCDLYAEDFDPRMTRAERLGYHDVETNVTPVADYVERLKAAQALVLCHPVWNFGYPAILKGFFDRVFLPGVSFTMQDGRVRPCLHNIGRLTVVTTYGGSRIRAVLAGDPPRKIATRVLRATIAPHAKITYLACYDMNRSSDESRQRFIRRVEQTMDRF